MVNDFSRSDHSHDSVLLTHDTIDIGHIITSVSDNRCGAISSFTGTTRDTFGDKQVTALFYEAYEPMAIKEMKLLCSKIRSRWDVFKIALVHKLGACPVGHTSIVIAISSAHRKDSLQAIDYAINELKASVPIWKKEAYLDESFTPTWKQNIEYSRVVERIKADAQSKAE